MPLSPKTYKLDTPVKAFADTVTDLTISREVDGEDLLEIEEMGKYRATLTWIHRLFRYGDNKQLPWESVLRLTQFDIRGLEETMAPFAGIGRGKKK